MKRLIALLFALTVALCPLKTAFADEVVPDDSFSDRVHSVLEPADGYSSYDCANYCIAGALVVSACGVAAVVLIVRNRKKKQTGKQLEADNENTSGGEDLK